MSPWRGPHVRPMGRQLQPRRVGHLGRALLAPHLAGRLRILLCEERVDVGADGVRGGGLGGHGLRRGLSSARRGAPPEPGTWRRGVWRRAIRCRLLSRRTWAGTRECHFGAMCRATCVDGCRTGSAPYTRPQRSLQHTSRGLETHIKSGGLLVVVTVLCPLHSRFQTKCPACRGGAFPQASCIVAVDSA